MMRGGSLQALQEILGHKDIKLTLRYAHLSPGHLRNEIEKTAARAAQMVPAGAEFSTTSAQDAKIEESPAVSA